MPVNRRNALTAGGLLALLLGGVGTASADPQGQVGTSGSPLEALYTEKLNGGITGNTEITDLTGDRLTIDDGALSASITGVADSGSQVYDNADKINFGDGLEVIDESNGAITVQTGQGATFVPNAIAYVDDDTLRTLAPDGTTTDYAPAESDILHLGTPADLTDTEGVDVPYINSDYTLRVATGDVVTTLDSDSAPGRVGVGDWDEDGTLEVVYSGVNGNYSTLHSVAVGEDPREFEVYDDNVAAVAGVAGFDGIGSQDVIWMEEGGQYTKLYYSSDPATGATDTGYSVDNAAIGTPADFDNDGSVEVPVADSGEIDLVTADGSANTLSTDYYITDQPMGAMDWTDNGVPDIMHVNSDTGELHYYNVVNDETAAVTDADGNSITPGLGGVVA